MLRTCVFILVSLLYAILYCGSASGMTSRALLQQRRLLSTQPSCACVCGGVHEGYVQGVTACLLSVPCFLALAITTRTLSSESWEWHTGGQRGYLADQRINDYKQDRLFLSECNNPQATTDSTCQTYSCVNNFPGCQYGGSVDAHFSDGSANSGAESGVITLQSASPENCQVAIIGGTCSQQYHFSVKNGFIQLITTSSDSCSAGSAQQSTAYSTKGETLANHVLAGCRCQAINADFLNKCRGQFRCSKCFTSKLAPSEAKTGKTSWA